MSAWSDSCIVDAIVLTLLTNAGDIRIMRWNVTAGRSYRKIYVKSSYIIIESIGCCLCAGLENMTSKKKQQQHQQQHKTEKTENQAGWIGETCSYFSAIHWARVRIDIWIAAAQLRILCTH